MSTTRADELMSLGSRRLRLAAVRARLLCTPDARPLDYERAVETVPADPNLLFVCARNSARSAFAARFAERAADRRGVSATATSSGVAHDAGRPTPPLGISTAAEYGVDLTKHRSTRLDASDVAAADVVFVLDVRSYRDVTQAFPDSDPFFLRPVGTKREHAFEVPDPNREGRRAYERAYDDVARAVRALFHAISGGPSK